MLVPGIRPKGLPHLTGHQVCIDAAASSRFVVVSRFIFTVTIKVTDDGLAVV